jgi:hypothetical protein
MTAGKNRVRLGVEHLENRCTPSDLGGGVAALSLPHDGGPHPEAAASVRAAPGHAVPIKLAFESTVDINSGIISSAGFGTGGMSHWTSVKSIDSAVIDVLADRGEFSGTGTLTTHNGDQFFFSFTTAWQLSTGEGTHSITITGGTGRLAGVTGGGIGQCIITADLASQTFTCEGEGFGITIFPHPV